MADFDWGGLAGAALGAAASIYTAKQNQKAIREATDAQTAAADRAAQAVQGVATQDPTTLPGYEFTRKQGEEAIMRSLRATGQSQSGAALKELQKYNTGLANQFYGQNFNRGLTVGQLMGDYGMRGAGYGAEGVLGQAQNRNAMIAGLTGLAGDPMVQRSIKDLIGSFGSQYKTTAPTARDQEAIDYFQSGGYY